MTKLLANREPRPRRRTRRVIEIAPGGQNRSPCPQYLALAILRFCHRVEPLVRRCIRLTRGKGERRRCTNRSARPEPCPLYILVSHNRRRLALVDSRPPPHPCL